MRKPSQVEAQQLELDLKPFEVDKTQADQLEKTANELAARPNLREPSTAVDKVFSNQPKTERISWSRRAFLFALGAFGSTIATPTLFDLTKKLATDRQTGVDLLDEWVVGDEFDDRFLNFVESNRRKRSFQRFEEKFPDADQKTKFVVGLIRNFDDGGHADVRSLKALLRLLNISKGTRTERFLTDLNVAELVRLGRGTWARKLLTRLDPSAIPPSERAFYIEKIFSTNYTSLSPKQYLSPSDWQFDKALGLFNDTVGKEIDMQLFPKEDLFKIKKQPNLTAKKVEAFVQRFSAPGFYSLFWAMQHHAALVSGKELADIAHLQYRLLQKFASHSNLERAVWNSLFIGAIQLHRQGANDLRDKFVRASLGLDSKFWGKGVQVGKTLKDRLSKHDPVPVCWSLFVNSIPGFDQRLSYQKSSHPRELLALGGTSDLNKCASPWTKRESLQEKVRRGRKLCETILRVTTH